MGIWDPSGLFYGCKTNILAPLKLYYKEKSSVHHQIYSMECGYI